MTRLVWGAAGSRFYETGVDRGVLYPPNSAVGVAWNGLTSVNEAPSGGDSQAYYLDGIKYLQVANPEEFNATIEALSAPPEFGACDGTGQIYAGLFITQQPRKQFGLCYRTLIGNDSNGTAYGYKIHIVYNALAKPSTRDNATLNDSPDAMSLSWDLTTVPPAITGFKPSAHLVIDSTLTDPDKLEAIEDILYGTVTLAPRLMSPQELILLYATWDLKTIVPNPTTGVAELTYDGIDLQSTTVDGIYQAQPTTRLTATETPGIYTLVGDVPGPPDIPPEDILDGGSL